MRCLKKDDLTAYLDEELSGNEIRRVAGHLEVCRRCREKLEYIRNAANIVAGKLELLRPETIPDKVFIYPPGETARPAPARRIKRVFRTSIRLPVPAFSLLIILFIFMSVILVRQHRQLSRLQAPAAATPQQAALFLVGSSYFQKVTPEIDLSGFEPIRQPRIFVTGGGKQ